MTQVGPVQVGPVQGGLVQVGIRHNQVAIGEKVTVRETYSRHSLWAGCSRCAGVTLCAVGSIRSWVALCALRADRVPRDERGGFRAARCFGRSSRQHSCLDVGAGVEGDRVRGSRGAQPNTDRPEGSAQQQTCHQALRQLQLRKY